MSDSNVPPSSSMSVPPIVERETQSSFPLPPMTYINLYSDENVKRGRAPKPPPIPSVHETYRMFGNVFHADDQIIRPLESQV